MRRISWIVLAVLAAGCTGKAAKKTPTYLPDEVTLEVENFKLTAAEVVDLKDAGGGKAVKFVGESSRAEKEVLLRRGTWEAVLYMKGEDSERDAVYLSLADVKARLYQTDGMLGEAITADVEPVAEIAADGAYKLVLTFAEPDVKLDRIILKKVK